MVATGQPAAPADLETLHEVAQQLDEAADILVRSGHHCCQPLMDALGLPDGTVRASLALYNTAEEIDMLLATLEELTR